MEQAVQLRAAGVSDKVIGDRIGKTKGAVTARLWRARGGDPKASNKLKARKAVAQNVGGASDENEAEEWGGDEEGDGVCSDGHLFGSRDNDDDDLGSGGGRFAPGGPADSSGLIDAYQAF